MDLLVIRHAIAEDRDADRWPDDADRPLTERGRRRFRAVASMLGAMVPPADVVLSSRLVRAWQTAALLSEVANWPSATPCPEMEFDAPEAVCDVLAQHADAGTVAVVGHEPSLSALVSALLCGDEDLVMVEMKKGGAVGLHLAAGPRLGAAELAWFLTPRIARTALHARDDRERE